MTGILNSLENTAPNAVIPLLAALCLQRLIENASNKLRDKMNKDHRKPKDSVSSPGSRVSKTKGMMQPQAPSPSVAA